jgi:hypothetical protein
MYCRRKSKPGTLQGDIVIREKGVVGTFAHIQPIKEAEGRD